MSRARHPRLVVAFMLTILAAQILIPARQLTMSRPARWGWQMYSAVRPSGEYRIVTRDGSGREVKVADYVANWRGELDLPAVLPEHLCRTIPDAIAVEVSVGDGPMETLPCSGR